MKTNRRLSRVAGEPAKIAARAAARLAYQGDLIEPVSPTEFIWRPQPAERRLFRCPRSVRVRVLPAEQPGYTTILLEWSGSLGQRWLGGFAALTAALGLALAFVLADSRPDWQLSLAIFPVLFTAAGPSLLDSGWLSRLESAGATGLTPGLAAVPEVERFLELDEAGRQQCVAALHAASASITSGPDQAFGGQDRRSTAELGGWPLWHIATGRDPVTDQVRTARGWYARGQSARGAVAVGQIARGWLAVGQMALGLVAVGQAALGLLVAVGQLAAAALFSLSQFGLGLIAIGMAALGVVLTSLTPPANDLGPLGLTATLLGIPLAGIITWLAVRAKLTAVEQRELLERLEGLAPAQQVAEETSLSLAERLTGDPDRGLSVSVGEDE